MDTELLKTFLEVEKTRHFGRAAENLYLTPAAVSARIRQLEGIIGIPLLTRSNKRVGLTPAGERLKPRAQEVLEALSRAVNEPVSVPKARQQFSMGGTPNLWDFFLEDKLQRVRETHSEFSLRAECHDSGYLISQLQSRQLDAAVMFDPIVLEGMLCEQIASMALCLYSTQPGVTVKDARQMDYVLVDWSVGFGMEHGNSHLGFAPALVSSTGRVALSYLAQNTGCAYLPAPELRDGLGAVAPHRVPDAPTIELAIYLLHVADNRKPALINTLREA